MGHKTTWTSDGCHVDVYDVITGGELAQINEEFCSSEHFDNVKYFIRDLTKIKSNLLQEDDIMEAAFIASVASGYSRRIRAAFVVHDVTTERLVKKFALYSMNAGSKWNIKIFKDAASAADWVGQPN